MLLTGNLEHGVRHDLSEGALGYVTPCLLLDHLQTASTIGAMLLKRNDDSISLSADLRSPRPTINLQVLATMPCGRMLLMHVHAPHIPVACQHVSAIIEDRKSSS